MIQYPNIAPSNVTWTEINTVARTESIFTRVQRFYVWSGQRWEADITIPPLTVERNKIFRGFLISLEGGINPFHFSPIIDKIASGNPRGLIVVNGSEHAYNRLNVSGLKPSTKCAFAAGDWFSIRNRLYMVQQNIDSDASGNAELLIFPSIHSSIQDGDVLNIKNPTGTFRAYGDLDMPSLGRRGISPPYTFRIQHIIRGETE